MKAYLVPGYPAEVTSIVPGDGVVDAVPVHRNYDGRGGDRVVFRKVLASCHDLDLRELLREAN
jgi:hypothetical protein